MATAVGVEARAPRTFWTARVEAGDVTAIERWEDLEAALDAGPEVDAVAIDVPVGHEDPDGEGDGLRACDRAARDLLGEARDRLLAVPPFRVLEADTYHEAVAACEAGGWPRLPAPMWHARERLLWIEQVSAGDEGLLEVHPEVSFAVLAGLGGPVEPMEHAGDTWASHHERLRALHAAGVHPEGLLEGREADPGRVLDAVAAALSAARAAEGRARRLPADPPANPRTGRPVALHA